MLHQKLGKVEQSKYLSGDEKERNVLIKISSEWNTALLVFSGAIFSKQKFHKLRTQKLSAV